MPGLPHPFQGSCVVFRLFYDNLAPVAWASDAGVVCTREGDSGSTRADRVFTVAMRLSVEPPDLRDDLLEFLRASSCLAVKRGAAEIDTHLLNSVSERHDLAVLIGYVESWKARHSGTRVEVVSD